MRVETMGIVLRLHGISISQRSLESRLGTPIVWARRGRNGSQSAQIDMTDSHDHIQWDAVVSSVGRIGGRIAKLIDGSVIATAELDIGLPFYERNAMASISVPAELCEIAGHSRVAITVTYYATSDDGGVSTPGHD